MLVPSAISSYMAKFWLVVQVGEVCLKAMYRLKEVADDRVTFRGNDYIRLCEIGGTNQPAYFGNSYERQRSS